MKAQKVIEITRPSVKYNALFPSVTCEDDITKAVEIMLNNDLTCISVKKNSRILGVIFLDDAMRALGLT